jgi:hypothetical protein
LGLAALLGPEARVWDKTIGMEVIRKMLTRRLSLYLILTILVVALLLALGCSASGEDSNDITGSGVLETRQFDYADFTQLALSQGFQANVNQADSFSVSLTMDDNMYDYLDMKQTEGKLYIRLEGGSYREYTAKVNITMPELRGLELSASSAAVVTDFLIEGPLDLDAQASSTIMFSDVQAASVRCRASSSSMVFGRIDMDDGDFTVVASSALQLEGSAESVSLDVTSSSSVNLAKFDVVDMSIELSAASSGIVNVSGRLDLGVHAVSYLQYFGDPIIGDYDVSTGSRVERG